MAEVWKKGKEFIDDLRDYPDFVINAELKKSFSFNQGDFTVNQYQGGDEKSPEALGMELKKTHRFDKAMYDKTLSFAKKRNLTVKVQNKFPMLALFDSKNRYAGLLTPVDFYATTPELFEAIGIEIYDLKT